ncbi:MAG: response regulator [Elusimicrobiota bacterium]|jgi:DNA-binding response OmpR family regulator
MVGEPKKVLIFEDNPEIQLILKIFFKKRGCEPLIHGDATEALELVRKIAPALVMMDIIMPGKDGVEACKELRAGGVQTPIVILTSKAFAEDRERGMLAGANAYLLKPFNPKELDAAVAPFIA